MWKAGCFWERTRDRSPQICLLNCAKASTTGGRGCARASCLSWSCCWTRRTRAWQWRHVARYLHWRPATIANRSGQPQGELWRETKRLPNRCENHRRRRPTRERLLERRNRGPRWKSPNTQSPLPLRRASNLRASPAKLWWVPFHSRSAPRRMKSSPESNLRPHLRPPPQDSSFLLDKRPRSLWAQRQGLSCWRW